MAIKYGIDFPFRESQEGHFLKMTAIPEKEVRANLIHLLLTKKGSRYFLPDFGTRLYQYIFDQNDAVTWGLIEEEIRDAIKKYIPNLEIQSIDVVAADQDPDLIRTPSMDEDERLFRVGDSLNDQYTASVRINYSVNNGTFSSSDFVIINI
jgi:phage baseplate assembly protein W